MTRDENERPERPRRGELTENQRPLEGQPDYGHEFYKPAEYYTPETPARPDRRPGPNPPQEK